MKLDLPFYENEGNRCMQTGMRVVLKYFLDKEVSLIELDALTKRNDEYWTYTSQIVPPLYDLGLDVKLFSKSDLEPFLEGESFIRKHYGVDAEKILKYTDLDALVNSVENLMKYDIFEKKVLTLDDMQNHLDKGHVPMVIVDNNIISGKKDAYQGHFIVLTGYDNKHVYYHESGPKVTQKNKQVAKDVFIKAINANGTDNDCVIVYGKRA